MENTLSQLTIPVFISWTEAQDLIRQQVVGTDIKKGKISLKVLNFFIREQAGKVFLQLQTSGTYDGDIIVTANPVFHRADHKIDFNELDLRLDTGNIFQKGMTLLLRRTIEKQLEKALNFTLEQPIAQLLKMVNQQLEGFRPLPNLYITGKVEEAEVQDLYYKPSGIFLQVLAKGHLEFFVISPSESKA